MDDRLDVKVLKRLDVRFIEEALQKQHALVPARAARAFGVAQVDGRKAVRIGEGLDFDSANALTVRKETVMTSEDLLNEEETQQEIVDMLK